MRCTDLGPHVGLSIHLCAEHEAKVLNQLQGRHRFPGRIAKPPRGEKLCVVRDAGGCVLIGHGVGYGLRLCYAHEEALLELLEHREIARVAHQVASGACGEATPPQLVYPGRGFEMSGGLPSLGKGAR